MSEELEVYTSEFPEIVLGVDEYIEASLAPSTRRMYTSLWKGFDSWCDYMHYRSMPASSEVVSAYFGHLAKSGKKAATINSVRAAIRLAQQAAGYPDPTDTAYCRQVLKGIRRTIGTEQVQKAATLPPDIIAMIDNLPQDTLIGKRDRAVILLGFFTASRRSELVALTAEDVIESLEGLTVFVRRSKTDQEGAGRTKAVTRQERKEYCAVRAVRDWREAAGIDEGPIFRSIGKGGRVSPKALSASAVAIIIKQAALMADLDPVKYAGHSLRSGLVTTAAKEGATLPAIMRQTGHQNVETVLRYMQSARLFEDTVTKLIKL